MGALRSCADTDIKSYQDYILVAFIFNIDINIVINIVIGWGRLLETECEKNVLLDVKTY